VGYRKMTTCLHRMGGHHSLNENYHIVAIFIQEDELECAV
jgi:hypothetical protein